MVKMDARKVQRMAIAKLRQLKKSYQKEREEFIAGHVKMWNGIYKIFTKIGLMKPFTRETMIESLDSSVQSDWISYYKKNEPYWFVYADCKKIYRMARKASDGCILVSQSDFEDLSL